MNLINSADDFLRMTQAYANLQDCIENARTKNVPLEREELIKVSAFVRLQLQSAIYITGEHNAK